MTQSSKFQAIFGSLFLTALLLVFQNCGNSFTSSQNQNGSSSLSGDSLNNNGQIAIGDQLLSLSLSDGAYDSSTESMVFTLSIDKAVNEPLSFKATSRNDTAYATNHYQSVDQDVVLAAGATSLQVSVPIIRSESFDLQFVMEMALQSGGVANEVFSSAGIILKTTKPQPFAGNWRSVPQRATRCPSVAYAYGNKVIDIADGIYSSRANSESCLPAIYDPVTNTRSFIPLQNGGPSQSILRPTIAVVGDKLIIWGGAINGVRVNSGKIYNLITGTWQDMSVQGAPSPRIDAYGIWTGKRLMIWGGTDVGPNRVPAVGGALYDPQTNTWGAISGVNAPPVNNAYSAYQGQGSHWDGEQAVIYPTQEGSNQGYLYNPATDTWKAMSTVGAPPPYERPTNSVMYGTKLFTWSSVNFDSVANNLLNNDGYIYDTALDQWQRASDVGEPQGRYNFAMCGHYDKVIVYGGRDRPRTVAGGGGGIFDLTTGTWGPLPTNGIQLLGGGGITCTSTGAGVYFNIVGRDVTESVDGQGTDSQQILE